MSDSDIGGCMPRGLRGDPFPCHRYICRPLSGGRPVGMSVPASEHSVMTAWKNETEAIENMIGKFGSGTFSVVMDSYDYAKVMRQ